VTKPRQAGTGRTQIRVGGRWQHMESDRTAIVTQILYPHFVEYRYERPTRTRGLYHGHMETEPFTRRTKVPYRVFVTRFTRPSS
jgi:hypothetical protein